MILEYLNLKNNSVDFCWIVQHIFIIYISSVYSPFSDGVGHPLHIIPSSAVLVKSI